MKSKLLEILACPRCLGNLELRDEVFAGRRLSTEDYIAHAANLISLSKTE